MQHEADLGALRAFGVHDAVTEEERVRGIAVQQPQRMPQRCGVGLQGPAGVCANEHGDAIQQPEPLKKIRSLGA